MSSSGQYQCVINTIDNYIYISKDYGQSWIRSNFTVTGLNVISISSSGQYVIVATSANVYYSTNYGMNCTPIFAITNPYGLAMSSSGQYVTLGIFNVGIYTCTIPSGPSSGPSSGQGFQNASSLYRYQAIGYIVASPTAPTLVSTDSNAAWINHLGGSLTNLAVASTNFQTKKYRIQSNVSSVTNGAVAGWLGAVTISPPILIGVGFRVVLSFGLTDTTTQAVGLTRSMIGLFQNSTAPVLNNTTTIASVTTQSIGIIQEAGETVWSFNTRGTGGSTKVATTIAKNKSHFLSCEDLSIKSSRTEAH